MGALGVRCALDLALPAVGLHYCWLLLPSLQAKRLLLIAAAAAAVYTASRRVGGSPAKPDSFLKEEAVRQWTGGSMGGR